MADNPETKPSSTPTANPTSPQTKATLPPQQPEPPKRNPALRALGIPTFRPRLPSRNWLIFLTLASSFTGTLLYDRRQTRLTQRKYATLVSHVAREPLSPTALPRRVTIYLAAPPGDGLRAARDYFREYVKPVLREGGVEWDVVEGRREGEVRRGVAEGVRRVRRKDGGEAGVGAREEERGEKGERERKEEAVADSLEALRRRVGVQECEGVKGDIVIGRNTWKEYVRGLHEGWLGPLEAPPPPDAKRPGAPSEHEERGEGKRSTEKNAGDVPATPDPELLITPTADPLPKKATPGDDLDPSPPPQTPPDDASPTSHSQDPESQKPDSAPKDPKPENPPKPLVPPPYNTPASYISSLAPPSIPAQLQPSTPIPFPHLLGFLNTPRRVYRFLTRRHLAEDVGRRTAAVVLATYRPYERPFPSAGADGSGVGADESGNIIEAETANRGVGSSEWEQQRSLRHEEREWHKSAWRRGQLGNDDDGGDGEGRVEREWSDEMVIDEKIGGRMRRFELSVADGERARRIGEGSAGIPGRVVEGEEEEEEEEGR